MTLPLRVVLDQLEPLLAVEPEWGFTAALALRSLDGGPAPARLQPWVELLDLRREPPDADRLGALLDRAAAEANALEGRERLLTEVAYVLPSGWAEALDAVRGPKAWPDPRFSELALIRPERAVLRIEQAMAEEMKSARAAGLLYAALIAWHDAGAEWPESARSRQRWFEAADPGVIDAEARYTGRLRLAARQDPDAAVGIAEEAVDWVGVQGAFDGVWALLQRVRAPRALAERLGAVIPRTPSPEVLIDALWRVTSVSAAELAPIASAFGDQVAEGEVWGERAWIAGFHLLRAAVGIGARAVVPALAAVKLPPWAIEIATWRALRTAPESSDEVFALLARAASEESWGLDWTAPEPPWANLGPELMHARLALLIDPRLPLSMHYPWGEGAP